MSQEKAQLIAPIGIMTVSGMTATGVITATSFSGNVVGSAKSLVNGTDVDVGVMTATSFAGNLTGNIQRLADSAPDISAGVTTATSFVGNLTGSVTDLTSQPAITVGLVTATSLSGPITGNVTGNITGNVTGLAASITPGSNLGVGVCTAIQYHGDGSGLTGAGSSAYIAQEVTASGNASSETIIDLTYGNVIYFNQTTKSTTVGFASTSPAEQITFIRDVGTVTPTFTTGGVTFDGTDDYLEIADSSDLEIASSEFTMECWFYQLNDSTSGAGSHTLMSKWDNDGRKEFIFRITDSSGQKIQWLSTTDGSSNSIITGNTTVTSNAWHHAAATRDSGGTIRMFLDGVLQSSTLSQSSTYTGTHEFMIAANGTDSVSQFMDGYISNVRFIKGSCLYTSNFDAPFYELTNITNTKLLCCQSDSSTTASAVTPATITAVSSPTAGAHTITSSSSVTPSITWPDRVKWNNGTTPTLIENVRESAFQIFHLTTADTGLNYNAWEEMKNDSATHALYAWGRNNEGGLGLNTQSPGANGRSSPTQVSGTKWSTLAGGFSFDSRGAIKSDGTLWMWGRNDQGQLGLNTQGDSRSSPTQIPGTTWSVVNAGGDNGRCTLAIKTDGTLWSWGGNEKGNLGLNEAGGPSETGNPGNQYSSPVQLPGTTWKDVSNGADWVLATKTDGTAWAWGLNQYGGMLAQADKTNRSSPTQIPGTNWAYMSAGRPYNSMAVKTDGSLWTWGLGNNGALGHNNTTGYSSPKQLPGTWAYEHPVKISSGFYRSYAIKSDNTLWAWGYQGAGELGDNSNVRRSSPVQVSGTTWESVANIYNVSLALKTDGTLWSWGSNTSGELGQNDTTSRSSPLQIPGTWKSGSETARSIATYQYGALALKVE